jgi:ATP-dependent helicase/nuclease subunit B
MDNLHRQQTDSKDRQMTKFLTQVAEYISHSHPAGLQDVLLCFPNNRAGYFLAEELKPLLSSGAWMPGITTLEKWVYSLSDKTLVQNVELINLLYRIYTELGGSDDFESFIPTAQTMLLDFDEVDKQLVNAKRLFKDLNDIKSLNTFLDEEETLLSEYSVTYRQFWDLFRDSYFRLTALLEENNKGYNGMIFRDVAEHIDQKDIKAYSKIYFIGFSGLSKAEQKIIAYLLDIDRAEFIIDADTYYLNDVRQEAGNFFREYKKSWRIKAFKWEQAYIGNTTKNIEVIGVARNIGQAKLTGDILQNHLKVSPDNLKDTVVVLLDEKLLQPVINALPDTIDRVNITMGLPLSYMQLADFMRHISDMQNNAAISSVGKKRFYHRDVIALLQHTYFRLLSRGIGSIPEAVRYIRSNNKITINKAELLDWFKEDTGVIDILFHKSGTAGEYIAHLISIIDLLSIRLIAIQTNGATVIDTDIEVLYWLKKVVTNLQQSLSVFEPVWDIKSIQKLIDNELRNTRLPFESDKAEGLQVMGIMETRCLDFKNVIVLSMNEGVFPSGKNLATFFPHDLRKGGTMTTHRERDAVAAYLFYRLMQRAENVYLVYNTESDLLGGGEKSRFILQIQHELTRFSNINIRERNFVLGAEVTQTERPIDIIKNEGVQKLLKTYLYEKGLSPTALNTYINCTLQFYFKNILGLREQDDIEESLEASTIGSAVHYALEFIYKEVLDKPLQVSYIKEVLADKEKIGGLIKDFLNERFEAESLKQGKNYLLYNVCKSLVINFLKNELHRIEALAADSKTITVTLLEQKMEQRMKLGDTDIYIHGNTDRVEQIDGVVSIADYKTGDSKKGKIKIDDMMLLKTSPEYSKAFQLMMYAWLYRGQYGKQTKGIRSGIYWLRHAEGKYESLLKEGSDLIGDSTLDAFEDIFREILTELLDVTKPFTKTDDKERCKFCDFVRICGRD